MRAPFQRLAARLALALSLAAAPALRAEVRWEPVVDPPSLYPSLIISTATIDRSLYVSPTNGARIGEAPGHLGFAVTAPASNCAFAAALSSPRFVRKSELRGVLPAAGRTYVLFPRVDYDFEALGRVREPVPETVTFELTLAGAPAVKRQVTVPVCSVHDCVYAVRRADGSTLHCGWFFAAYVNEGHPSVEKILKSALDLQLVRHFSGYQDGPQHVYAQLYAVWNVLQQHGLKYSDVTTPSAPSEQVASQHVRFLDESLAGGQANCVDGSVLLASVFRKIGLKTYLVVTPAHCLVGCVVRDAPRESVFLETTEIGTVDLRRKVRPGDVRALLAAPNYDLSRASFQRAQELGSQAFEAAKPHFGKTPGYDLVDLDLARARGLLPLRAPPPARP